MQPAVPREPSPDPGPMDSPPPDGGWRWEATGALVCVPLFGGWLWLTDGSVTGCGQGLLAVLLGTGIGLACPRAGEGARTAGGPHGWLWRSTYSLLS